MSEETETPPYCGESWLDVALARIAAEGDADPQSRVARFGSAL